MKLIDLTGKACGRWTVLAKAASNVRGGTQWLCRCECGKESVLSAAGLRNGKTKSCGCLRDELASQRATTHGATRGGNLTREFSSWRSAKQRCFDRNCPAYARYGAVGITMCDRWKDSFENFLADMGQCADGLSLDRYPNNSGNYEPGNCRWATITEQNRNQKKSIFVEWSGRQWSLGDLADHVQCLRTKLYRLIHVRGFSTNEAVARCTGNY